MIKILVVCTGNTCRSPMAQELLDDAVDRSSNLRGKVKCKSAGTFACEDAEATPEAMEVMEDMGFSLEKHKARQFTEELAEKYDLLLAMGPEVFEQMEALAPDYVDKMHTIIGYANGIDGDVTGDEYSIIDPFDEDVDEYRACANQLKEVCEKLVERLEKEYA